MKPVAAIAALVVLISFFDNFAQLPIISPYARSLGASSAMIGLIVAAYSIANLGGNAVAGLLLDRWGRRQTLLLGLLGTAVALPLYALAGGPWQLLGARGAHGILGGILTPAAFTLVGDVSPQHSRGQAMGATGAVIGIAAIAAPLYSGILRDLAGYDFVYLSIAAMFLVTLGVVYRTIEEPVVLKRKEAGSIYGGLPWRRLLVPCTGIFGLTVSLGLMTVYFPLHAQALGYGSAQVGMMFSVFALVAVIAMITPLSRISDRRGRLPPMLAGLGAVTIALALMPLVNVLPPLLAAAPLWALYGLGFGLTFPASNAAVADAVDAERRGRGFALFYIAFSLGIIAGSTMAGVWSGSALGRWLPPYFPGAAVVIASALAALNLGRRL